MKGIINTPKGTEHNKKIIMSTLKKISALFALAAAFFLAGTHGVFAATCDSALLNGYVNPNGYPTQAWFEYDTNSSDVSNGNGTKTAKQTFSVPSYYKQSITGLSENTTYYYRAAFSNQAGTAYGSVKSFQTLDCSDQGGDAPEVTTNAATNVQDTSATLRGYVDVNGSDDTVRWFEWGRSSSDLDRTTSRISMSDSGSVSVSISDLSPNTRYYFRLHAENDAGSDSGSTLSFTTSDDGGSDDDLPEARTRSASDIDEDSATLNGYIDTNGTDNVERWFEWGRSSSDLDRTTSRSTISSSRDVSAYISGLDEDTTYYFRVVARNDAGTVRGSTYSFRTDDNGSGDDDDLPSVSTRSATNINSTSATLNGYVNTNGTDDVERWFEWGRSSSDLDNTTSRNSIGYSGDASAYISGLNSNTTYYFRIVARNDAGTVYGSVYSFTTRGSGGGDNGDAPIVTTRSATSVTTNTATLNGHVDANGGSDTSAWFEWGTTESMTNVTTRRNQGDSSANISAALTGLRADTVYYFRAVAQNSRGTSRGTMYTFTTARSGGGSQGQVPTVITTLPTNITGYSATFNSLILQSGNSSSEAWFEWGSSEALGRRTSTKSVGSAPSLRHTETVNELTPGVTYYYRIVAENQYGRNYGTLQKFVTRSSVVTPPPTPKPTPKPIPKPVPVPTPKPTVVYAEGVNSLVMLTIVGEEEGVSKNEQQTYTITWHNKSEQTLKDVVLRIMIPAQLSFISADDGQYSTTDGIHTLELGTLKGSETGELNIVLKGSQVLVPGDLIVTTANLVYTDESNVQGDALAYVTQRGEAGGSVLGASAAGGAFPYVLLGWLLLIILLIILVILSHHLYKRLSQKNTQA